MTPGFDQNTARFGAPLGQYRGGLALIMYVIGALVVFALGAVMLLAGIGSQDIGGMIALIVFGVLFFALGGYLVWRVISSIGTHVELYEGGFSVTQRGKTTQAAWTEVNTITQAIVRQTYYGIPVWTSYTYKLALASGANLRFTEALGKVREMGQTMQRKITAALAPRALQGLRSGATLPFGKLSLTPMGISNGTETLPWHEISNVATASGGIYIYRAGKKLRWASASVSRTPNVYVLLGLIDTMRRSAAPAAPAPAPQYQQPPQYPQAPQYPPTPR